MPPDHPQTPLGTTDRFIQNNLLSRTPGLGPPLVDGDLGSLDGIRLVRELGAGGAATVYQGRIEGTDECVAVKVFTGEADDALRARVEQEAAVAGALNETGLFVRVKSYKKDHTPPYLVMDYIPGETLQERLARTPGGKLAAAEAALIARDVALGLQALHGKSFVHQDVKPGNVFLPEPGQASRPCAILLDLGAAFPFRTRGPKRAKTKAYASPEQLTAAGDITPRTDVYSFGMTLYHMLVGEPPPTRQLEEVSKRLRANKVPPALARLCVNCLSREPLNRRAAAGLVTELTGYLERRKRLRTRVFCSVIALILLCVTGGVVYLDQARQAAVDRAEKSRAQVEAAEAAFDNLFRQSVERSERLTRRVADPLAEPNGELLSVPWLMLDDRARDIADRLKALLDELEQEPGPACPEAAAVIPLAWGTLALLDRRFEDALGRLPPEAVSRLADRPVLAHRGHLVRGFALAELDRPAEAAVEFRQAVALDPDSFFATQGLAHALAGSGQAAEGVEVWARYITRLEQAIGGSPKPGGLANRLVLALMGKAAIECDIGGTTRARALTTLVRVGEVIEALEKQNAPGIAEKKCDYTLLVFEILIEMGDRERAFEVGRSVVTVLRAGDVGRTFGSLLTSARFIAQLEVLAEGTTGPDRAMVYTLLGAALCARATLWIELKKYPKAITDADWAIAIIDKELRPAQSGEWTRADLMMAYTVRTDARWKVGRTKFSDPTPGAVEAWVRLALTDADKVVEFAEEGLRRGEPAEADLRCLVEGRLGATLWRRAAMHAELGSRERAVTDSNRAVEILSRVVIQPTGGQWASELQAAVDCRARLAGAPGRMP